MIKHCKNLLDHIFRKWPKAELYMHDTHVINNNELTIIYQNHWFITVYSSSYKVSVIVYIITGSVKNSKQGFQSIKEYQIGKLRKDGKHLTTYSYCTNSGPLVKVRWTLTDLVNNLESEVGNISRAEDVIL